ncbi:hypothetical protein [Sorangium sp. So ce128]|uniref:hypothetical protein n=1 Tax=Sorangium sp. So ce128 TaxID=3133281 RepID=UPI003F61F765
MAETDNIARMAEKVGEEIFDVFGWTRRPPVNQNWSCSVESHGKLTHPSDVVFWYDDPYRVERIYWNVDLKSYGAATITKAKVAGAIASLGKSVECANVSAGWQQLYGDDENTWRCDGLLFVYNHDGEFDKDFCKIVEEVDPANLRLPPRRRMAIIGPPDVSYLVNVAQDIVTLRGRKKIPLEPVATEFWYPDLVRPKRREQSSSAATIEMLTGPWITIHIRPDYNGGKREFLVYYRNRGTSIEEFKYLIDSFFRFQMLAVDRDTEIAVRLVDSDGAGIANFNKAKEQISTSLYGLGKVRLDRVRCESVPLVRRRFSEIEIGMEAR